VENGHEKRRDAFPKGHEMRAVSRASHGGIAGDESSGRAVREQAGRGRLATGACVRVRARAGVRVSVCGQEASDREAGGWRGSAHVKLGNFNRTSNEHGCARQRRSRRWAGGHAGAIVGSDGDMHA
jgi:hypothetical protein